VKKAIFTFALICSLQIHLFSRRLLKTLLSKARLFLSKDKLKEALEKAKLSESDIEGLKGQLKQLKQPKKLHQNNDNQQTHKKKKQSTHPPGKGQIPESEFVGPGFA